MKKLLIILAAAVVIFVVAIIVVIVLIGKNVEMTKDGFYSNKTIGSMFAPAMKIAANIPAKMNDNLIDSCNKDSIKINFESHIYQVQLLKEARLFIFKDVTDFENTFSYNQHQAPVVGYIAIDNYS